MWLEDIKRAVSEINEFTSSSKNFSDFSKDLKTQKAIERELEIIGEAMNRILKVCPNVQITSAKQIVATRNRIIHGYDTVSCDIIWLIITKHLPILSREIEEIIQELDKP